MKHKLKWDEFTGILLLAAGVFMLGVSVFLCFSSDIWYDELFTMGLGNQSLGGLVSITAADVHPPLYYMIVKLFLELGAVFSGSVDQIVIAKLVSILPFLLCMIYAVTKVRKHFGMLSAGLLCFLLLSMPKLADYTVEIRMYGYALFFIMAGMLHAYEIAGELADVEAVMGNRNRIQWSKMSYVNWIAVTLYSLAACYTHYFACVAACMIYVYLLIAGVMEGRWKQLLKPFWGSGLVCVAGYLPWLVTVVVSQVGAVKENYWIQPLSFRTLGGCVKFLFQPMLGHELLNVIGAVILFAIYGLLFVVTIFRWLKKGEKTERRKAAFVIGSIGCLAGIVLFGFGASAIVRPIFVYRYMLPAMGVIWLAFVVMVSELKNKKILIVPLVLLLVLVGARNYRSFYGEEMWKRVQMDKTQEALAQIGKEDIVIYNFNQTQAVVSCYLDNDSRLWAGEPEKLIRRMYPENRGLTEGEFEDEKGMQEIRALLEAGETVWYLGSGNAREEIIEKWKTEGIAAQEEASVLLERYWFNIYRIKSVSDIDGAEKKR